MLELDDFASGMPSRAWYTLRQDGQSPGPSPGPSPGHSPKYAPGLLNSPGFLGSALRASPNHSPTGAGAMGFGALGKSCGKVWLWHLAYQIADIVSMFLASANLKGERGV